MLQQEISRSKVKQNPEEIEANVRLPCPPTAAKEMGRDWIYCFQSVTADLFNRVMG